MKWSELHRHFVSAFLVLFLFDCGWGSAENTLNAFDSEELSEFQDESHQLEIDYELKHLISLVTPLMYIFHEFSGGGKLHLLNDTESLDRSRRESNIRPRQYSRKLPEREKLAPNRRRGSSGYYRRGYHSGRFTDRSGENVKDLVKDPTAIGENPPKVKDHHHYADNENGYSYEEDYDNYASGNEYEGYSADEYQDNGHSGFRGNGAGRFRGNSGRYRYNEGRYNEGRYNEGGYDGGSGSSGYSADGNGGGGSGGYSEGGYKGSGSGGYDGGSGYSGGGSSAGGYNGGVYKGGGSGGYSEGSDSVDSYKTKSCCNRVSDLLALIALTVLSAFLLYLLFLTTTTTSAKSGRKRRNTQEYDIGK